MKTFDGVWSLNQTQRDFLIVDVLARVRGGNRLVGAYTIGASRRFALGLEFRQPTDAFGASNDECQFFQESIVLVSSA